eukprot:Gb_29458 [translate_table: standard]
MMIRASISSRPVVGVGSIVNFHLLNDSGVDAPIVFTYGRCLCFHQFALVDMLSHLCSHCDTLLLAQRLLELRLGVFSTQFVASATILWWLQRLPVVPLAFVILNLQQLPPVAQCLSRPLLRRCFSQLSMLITPTSVIS